ncbi:hypothetical protein BDY19DRAFT_996648 [Irpex rosettiformis]|uniref:Uncharacterized protein n=1 Tax=Irpex rosettiformis TaxID=378272 RepID=A0ACB8TTV7_9APHY|nr:hypothetical protein BDY19DRAFT_996648 [Irpex rosettiformis]
MPAPTQLVTDSRQARPILGHVNLMVDTLLANASADEQVFSHRPAESSRSRISSRLRAIVRGLLSSGSPAITTAFLGAARRRLTHSTHTTKPIHGALFQQGQDGTEVGPTAELQKTLRRARTLYGAGLGFASLKVLAQPVRAIADIRQENTAAMEGMFAEIDADISQALQSCREEFDSGRLSDVTAARLALDELKAAVKESQVAVQSWRGAYPFERAATSLEYWKI